MAVEKKQSFKESRSDTLGFLVKATPEQLLGIVGGTALRSHPQVANFNDSAAPTYFQKTDALRRLIVQEFNRHADFRGLVIRAAMQMEVLGAKPGAGEGTSNPKSGEAGQPKKKK